MDLMLSEEFAGSLRRARRPHGLTSLTRPLILPEAGRGTGQHESANDHLATAATMFRDMGMRSWLEKATAAMDEGSR